MKLRLTILFVCVLGSSCTEAERIEIEVVGESVQAYEFPSYQAPSHVIRELVTGGSATVISRRFAPVIGSAWLQLSDGGWVLYDEHVAFRGGLDLDDVPAFRSPIHDLAPTTGIAGIDSVVEMVIAEDAAALAERAELTSRECGGNDTGDFPCPEGSIEGDLVPVFTFVSCHGQSEQEEELVSAFRQWLGAPSALAGDDDPKLYAVFDSQYYQHGSAGTSSILVFGAGPGHSEALLLGVDPDGSIVFALTGCGPLPVEMAVDGVPEFIVPSGESV